MGQDDKELGPSKSLVRRLSYQIREKRPDLVIHTTDLEGKIEIKAMDKKDEFCFFHGFIADGKLTVMKTHLPYSTTSESKTGL